MIKALILTLIFAGALWQSMTWVAYLVRCIVGAIIKDNSHVRSHGGRFAVVLWALLYFLTQVWV